MVGHKRSPKGNQGYRENIVAKPEVNNPQVIQKHQNAHQQKKNTYQHHLILQRLFKEPV